MIVHDAPVPTLAELHEVHRLGGRASAFRTADQTAAALFWLKDPANLWQHAAATMLGARGDVGLATQGVALVAQATAQANVLAEAQRSLHPVDPPEAFIHGTAPSRLAPGSLDPHWEPLVQRADAVGFPSIACVSGGATVGVLRALLGDDGTPVTLMHSELGLTRAFACLTAMLQEAEDAQVWAGVCFRSALVDSTEMGLQLGEWVARSLLGM